MDAAERSREEGGMQKLALVPRVTPGNEQRERSDDAETKEEYEGKRERVRRETDRYLR